MKTNMNITRIAQMSIASSALFFFTSLMPVQAETAANSSASQELADVTYRLETLVNGIEASIRFIARPVSNREEILYHEAEVAAARLENLNSVIEQSVRFEAPAVDGRAEAAEYEVNQAIERLNGLTQVIGASMRFQAPAADEVTGAF